MIRFLFSALLLLATVPALANQVCNPNIPASTPSERFTVHGDGTATDNRTGLMWKRCAEGQSGSDCATGSVTGHNWQQALELADSHSYAGYSDWRLPNIKELASIVELRCYSPAVNLEVFPSTPSSWFWSSSANSSSSSSAWGVNFGYGNDRSSFRYYGYAVRLVRGGQ